MNKRKPAGESPSETQANLQSLFDTVDDLFLVFDRKGRILHCNAAARNRLGYTEKELLELSAIQLHPPEQAKEAEECFAGLLKGKKSVCTIPMISRDGKEIPLETKVTRGHWGKKKALFGVSRDTSNRSQAEHLTHIQRDLAIALSQTFDLKEALKLFLEASLKATDFDCGGIYLLNDEDKSLELFVHRGLSEQFIRKISRFEADTPQSHMVHQGKPLYVTSQKLGFPVDDARLKEGILAVAIIPVLFQGHVVACLNVASHRSDEITAFARNALEYIATPIGSVLARIRSREAVENLSANLEAQVRKRTAELAAVNAQLLKTKWQQKALLDSIPDIAWLKDLDSRFIAANEPFGQACGVKPEDLVGKTDLDIWPGNLAAMYRADDREVIRSGRMKRVEEPLIDINGRKIWIETLKVPILNADGQVIGTAGVARDITDRKLAEAIQRQDREELESLVHLRTIELLKANEHLRSEIAERIRAEEALRASLAEKEILLKEIHHRVKNNLQIISSLLNLQSKYSPDEKSREAFMEIRNRITSIAFIHEKLYKVKDYSNIDFPAYLKSLTDNLIRSYAVNPNHVRFVMEVEDVFLSLDLVVPCGLIVNELVSNCLKHAFPTGEKGEIYIKFSSSGQGSYTLIIKNKGSQVTFPENLDLRQAKTLGLQLVCTLTSQLRGEISLSRLEGTEFSITFPGEDS
ncbi:MAG: PAS domain S-box protein [bacterium]